MSTITALLLRTYTLELTTVRGRRQRSNKALSTALKITVLIKGAARHLTVRQLYHQGM
jgi:hypothetical protein